MIGAGPAGLEAARSLAGLGHAVTVIDRSAVAAEAAAAGAKVPGIEVLPSTTLSAFDGFPGSFQARLLGPSGSSRAHLRRRDRRRPASCCPIPRASPFAPGKIVPLPSLSATSPASACASGPDPSPSCSTSRSTRARHRAARRTGLRSRHSGRTARP